MSEVKIETSKVSNSGDIKDSEVRLKRTMGFWGLVFFGVVFMNPTAVFSFFGVSQITSTGHSTLVFVVGGLAVFFTGLSYAKMVQVYPNAGSAYTYASKGINPKLGFLVGWTMLLDYVLTPMFILTLVGLYLNRTFPAIPTFAWMIIVAAVALTLNIVGLLLEDIFNIAAIVFQLGIVASFSILASIYLVNNGAEMGYSAVIFNPEAFDLKGVLTVATLAVLSFLGFDGMSTLAEESRIEPKVVSKSIITAVLIQAVCLIGLAYICSLLFPDYTKILTPDTFAYDLYTKVGGSNFNYVVVTAQQFLAFTSMVASTTSASRLLYSMGRSNVIPKGIFGHLSVKFRTPTYNSIIIMALCLVGGFIFNWSIIAEIVAFGAMFGFACVNLAVINQFFIREKQGKLFKNLIMPLLGFIFIIYVMINSSVMCKTVGLIWLGLGIVYLIVRSRSQNFRDSINKGLDID